MKLRGLLVAVKIMISLTSFGQLRHNDHLVEITGARITIDGSTNLSSFSCGFMETKKFEAIPVSSGWTDLKIYFQDLIIQFPVARFDCGMELMTQDFHELVKAERFPILTLQINQIKVSPSSLGFELLDVETEVMVTLAGVTRRYWISGASVINRTEEDMTLKGTCTVKMTDFGVIPPTKFFGTVRANDALLVNFEVDLFVQTLKKGRG